MDTSDADVIHSHRIKEVLMAPNEDTLMTAVMELGRALRSDRRLENPHLKPADRRPIILEITTMVAERYGLEMKRLALTLADMIPKE